MKFIHTSDLHIGKTVNEISMLEEQGEVLRQVREIAVEEKADAVVIAGDVYDRQIPSAEAVVLLDDFLTALLGENIPVIMISGNHDSGERVAFADRILQKQGLYIAGGYDGTLKQVTFEDEWGRVTFVCMPFVKPAVATVEEMLSRTPMTLDLMSRRVLVTHYFVTGEDGKEPELSDSETSVNVGGLDNVPAAMFGCFDYVALGHIHKRQKIGAGQVWYAGAPLKYSFSEVNQKKGVNVVTLGQKGQVEVAFRALTPLHEMRVMTGNMAELTAPERWGRPENADYIKAVLTDKEEFIDPIGTLRSIYPNIMQIEWEKNERRQAEDTAVLNSTENKTTGELFADFYELLRGEPMDERRKRIVREVEEEMHEA